MKDKKYHVLAGLLTFFVGLPVYQLAYDTATDTHHLAAADKYVNYSEEDDLGGSGSPASPVNEERYRINEVELDFERQTIKVTRIGARNTAGGRLRDTITFPFKKGGTS